MRVHAAAVNFPDVLLIAGKYQIRIPVPFTPGSELAGEVLTAGAGAPFAPGQRVFGTTAVGAFAERALLDAASATLVPDDADLASAAAFGVTYRTAYHALRSVGQVSEGDWVVVLGAAGAWVLPPSIWRSPWAPVCWPPPPARTSWSCARSGARRRPSTTTTRT
ncbi:alcohol dehydrogenase GroES-like domain protein [Mycobacterium kansasii 824]|uniref:Alcohol dehydrogenase GroES-like domain protein n=1 Tax=Mycobacterium kansasii TaxID=1768 RepID=A0A1V3XAE3_MYCKA|nr:alcohol dehydrogenase GroES-like domain protein [Mycobacterium kansasii 824]OOK75421.1 alcohol dehydrogenase GroES-like domain protein [Mycobacterium kansasii]